MSRAGFFGLGTHAPLSVPSGTGLVWASGGRLSTVVPLGSGLTFSAGSLATTGSSSSSSSGEAFPVGSVFLAAVSTNPATLLGYGTWSAIGAGRVLVGYDSGDTDFNADGKTGGAKTVASAGSVAAPTISGSTAAESSHTHTYTDVVQHTHTVNVTDPGHNHTQNAHTHTQQAQGGTTGSTTGTHIMTSTATGGSLRNLAANEANGSTTATNVANTTGITAATVNPAGSVATGSTAAGSSHSHGAGALAASAPTFAGSATSVVQPYFVVHMWQRTA